MGCQHLVLRSVWPVWNGGGMLRKLAMSARLRSGINIPQHSKWNDLSYFAIACLLIHLKPTVS